VKYAIMLVLAVFQLVHIDGAIAAGGTIPGYFGQLGASIITPIACGAAANAQVPGTTDLFVGRQFFKQDGSLTTAEEKCGNNEGIREAIRSSRWGIVLAKLDWQHKKFTIVKPLIAPMTEITGGPMKGAVIKKALDPQMVIYRGEYVMTFECIVIRQHYRIQGTSACIATYDPVSQQVRLDRTYVAVSGRHTGPQFHSASVPQLLVFGGNLFLYWSELTIDPGRGITRIGVRGVQLEADTAGFYWAKGIGHMVYSINPPTVEVWGPYAGKPMSDTAVDIKSLWVHGNEIIALAGLGGGGCASQGPQPGCFRMALAKSSRPLGDHVFNDSPLLHEEQLPTNGQGYTRPIRNPAGGYSFIGSFRKPPINGYSEIRPVPPVWGSGPSAIVMFPFPDKNLWPTQ